MYIYSAIEIASKHDLFTHTIPKSLHDMLLILYVYEHKREMAHFIFDKYLFQLGDLSV